MTSWVVEVSSVFRSLGRRHCYATRYVVQASKRETAQFIASSAAYLQHPAWEDWRAIRVDSVAPAPAVVIA